MRKHLANTDRRTWSAAALCVAAALFLGWQVSRSEHAMPAEQLASPEEEQSAGTQEQPAGFKLPPPEEYEEIVMRPLFNRSRRPDRPEEVPQGRADGSDGKAAPATQIALNGVVLSKGRRVALLRLDNDPKVMHVGEGQQAGGWLIDSIRPDRIILKRGDTATEVVLNYKRTNGASGTQIVAPEDGVSHDNVVTGEGEEPQD